MIKKTKYLKLFILTICLILISACSSTPYEKIDKLEKNILYSIFLDKNLIKEHTKQLYKGLENKELEKYYKSLSKDELNALKKEEQIYQNIEDSYVVFYIKEDLKDKNTIDIYWTITKNNKIKINDKSFILTKANINNDLEFNIDKGIIKSLIFQQYKNDHKIYMTIFKDKDIEVKELR